MRRILFLLVLLFSIIQNSPAQSPSPGNTVKVSSARVDSINRLLDFAVVHKQIDVLKKYYADEFVFTHGTGLVDSKASWLKNVMDKNASFISRTHDSTFVEMHGDVAIAGGTLTVKRKDGEKDAGYALRYIRVFRLLDNRWQLISHRTTREWHFK